MRMDGYSTGGIGPCYGLYTAIYNSNYLRNTLYDYRMFLNTSIRPNVHLTLGQRNPYLFSMRRN